MMKMSQNETFMQVLAEHAVDDEVSLVLDCNIKKTASIVLINQGTYTMFDTQTIWVVFVAGAYGTNVSGWHVNSCEWQRTCD